MGRQMILPPPIASPQYTNNSIKSMREEQLKMLNSFWHAWKTEYLATLMQRKNRAKDKEPLKIGQIVIVHDENTAPAHWPLGKIIELITSKDGLVRSVVVEMTIPVEPDTIDRTDLSKETRKRTTTKLTRPVQKICVLPTESDITETGEQEEAAVEVEN